LSDSNYTVKEGRNTGGDHYYVNPQTTRNDSGDDHAERPTTKPQPRRLNQQTNNTAKPAAKQYTPTKPG